MTSTLVGLLAFVCTFGGALMGMWLRGRLPAHHLSDESRDSVKVGVALIATMTALVLGLITASAKSSFDAVGAAITKSAADLITLDRVLARYGPETAEIRRGMKRVVGLRIEAIWPEGNARPTGLDPMASGSEASGEAIADAIRVLQPRDESQKALQSRALDIAEGILQGRWLTFAGQKTSAPAPF